MVTHMKVIGIKVCSMVRVHLLTPAEMSMMELSIATKRLKAILNLLMAVNIGLTI